MVNFRFFNFALLAMALALALGSAPAARADDPFANSKVRLADLNGDGGYRRTQNPVYADVRQKMMKRQVLEEYAKFLSPLRLPKTLWIFAEECEGGVGASPHYSPGARAMVMCYQFMKLVEDRAAMIAHYQAQDPSAFPWRVNRDGFLAGAFTGVILHETGHAIFDILDVPVFGREEDAADEMSTFVALQFSRPLANVVVAAYADLAETFANPPTEAPNPKDPHYPKDAEGQCFSDPFCAWADVHGSWGQRFFNTLCLTYGADPSGYAFLAAWLPKDRDCPAEYKRVYQAFAKTVYPFIDPAQRTLVQAHPWFRANELLLR